MKNLILLFLSIVLGISNIAAKGEPIESKIAEVTVYKEGATVTRTGNINIPKESSQLELVGLPSDLTPESIEITTDDNIEILSIKSELVYSYINYENVKHLALLNSIQDLRDSITLIEKHAKAFQSEQSLIQHNKSLIDSEKFSVEELKKLAEFHNSRIIEIENTMHVFRRSLRSMNSRLLKLKNQSKRNSSDETEQTYSIYLDIENNTSGSSEITIRYYVEDAGWKSTYDVKVASIRDPLDIIYKADIYQNTAEDWNDVNITVSSSIPNFGRTQPYVDPYFLYFNNWISKPSKTNRKPLKGNLLKGRITDGAGHPLIGANIMVKNTSIETITDVDGIFELTVPSSNATIIASYTGYKNYESRVTSGFMDIQLRIGELLEEVVVSGMGSNTLQGRVSGVSIRGHASVAQRRAEMEKENSYSQGVNKFNPRIEYPINNKTTIISGEEPKTIKLKTISKVAHLSYLSIPKYDEAAYLIAKIKDWHDLNLQSGDYNVIFEGKYLTSYILNVDDIEDDLEISLGLDENIRIKRTPIKEFTKKKFLSKDIQEEKAWKLEVTNSKNVPIQIELIDQFPISKNSAIKVDLKSHDNGIINEETGEVKWTLNIPPSEAVSRTLRYEVKHSKDRSLIVD